MSGYWGPAFMEALENLPELYRLTLTAPNPEDFPKLFRAGAEWGRSVLLAEKDAEEAAASEPRVRELEEKDTEADVVRLREALLSLRDAAQEALDASEDRGGA